MCRRTGLLTLHLNEFFFSINGISRSCCCYLNFQVRFFLVMLWTRRLDTAAKETWARGQFSLYHEWYGRLMYNTYPIPTETPRLNLYFLINQSDRESKLKQINNGQNLNILRGLLWASKLRLFSLKCYRRAKDMRRNWRLSESEES